LVTKVILPRIILRKKNLPNICPWFCAKTTEVITLFTLKKHFNSCTYVSTVCYRMPLLKSFVKLGTKFDSSRRNSTWMFR
jgi:hypothetical protein